MKIRVNVNNSIVETKKYVDAKTGNTRERVVATIGGFSDSGEMLSCVIYGDGLESFKLLPKSGVIIVDCYKYESQNQLMGNAFARSFQLSK